MPPASTLLLEERFAAASEQFLPELLATSASGVLANLAEKLVQDARPAIRAALLGYIDDGCDRPGHRPLVKRLFKLAEARADDEVMAHFLVAFDRLVRRKIVLVPRWDYSSRQSYQEPKLRTVTAAPGHLRNPRATDVPRFSLATRNYLRRRALRYFRRMGARDPARFRAAVLQALSLYDDRHLDGAEALLDAWGLTGLLFQRAKVLVRGKHAVRLAPGGKLADLEPAPMYPKAWAAASFDELFALLEGAHARVVREFAAALLREHHREALAALPIARLRSLLDSPHPELQLLGIDLFEHAGGIDRLPIGDWLELLELQNLELVARICALVERHVAPSRLSFTECVALARSGVAPVAALGLRWAREKGARTPAEIRAAYSLAAAPVAAVRADATRWALELVRRPQAAVEEMRELIDARFADVRSPALGLLAEEPRFRDSAVLWASLAESPYADARGALLQQLERVESALAPDAVRALWATTLHTIHGGGRGKRRAIAQLAAHIARAPADADALLPLLGVALRSVRITEQRSALAALARTAGEDAGLRAAVARWLPELTIGTEVIR